MKIAEIDFPIDLLNALRDDELVIFAGAGVSMGEPACLPSFKHLAKMIAKGTGETLPCRYPIDQFLGGLQHEGVKVHERAAEILFREDLKATELHRNLLRFYSDTEQIRIVTTNFDLLFEQAAEDLFGRVPEVFRASALPSGGEFNGIVHIHGSINHPDEMVITVKDFGRAYMAEIRAAPFLVELFSNFKILFIGYSYGDTIMNYLTEALTGHEEDRCFALIGDSDDDSDRWHRLGIKPIIYPQSNKDDHRVLNEGVRSLANLKQWQPSDWERKITMIAESPPPLDEATEDLIEYAFTDTTRIRFFTKAATAPEWINWLDKRGYLNALFDNSTFSERDKRWSWWLAEQFAYDHPNQLFLLLGKHNMHLQPDFWHDLARQIGTDREASWDPDILSRWISLLLNTVQEHINVDDQANVGIGTLLHLLGERCIQHDILDGLLQIVDAMMGSRIQLKEGFAWPNDDESNESPPVNLELLQIGSDHVLSQLWEEGLKPKLSQVAEPLLNCVIKRLEEQHIVLRAWQGNDCNWERENDESSVMNAHDMVRFIARECLECLISEQLEVAGQWCDRLVRSDVPPLRRLAIHGLSKRKDLTADEKVDWLLTYINLYESSVRRAVFQAVELVYPQASSERRQALIEAVWAYRWPDEEDPNKKVHTARQHFYWFDRLHKSDFKCPLVEQALNKILGKHPEFKREEPVNLAYSDSSDWGAPQSPWSAEELLAKPAADWLNDLLSFQITEEEYFDQGGIRKSIAEAIRQNFDWGLDLAKAIGRAEKWDVYVWSVLINTWSRMDLAEDQHSKVLSWLGKIELYPKHNHEIAEALYALVRGGSSYTLNLLPQANKIAAALWHDLDRTEPIEKWDDYQDSPSGHPTGWLVNFWLSGLSLWQNQQASQSRKIRNEYRRILTDIVEDQSLPGRLGRMILASQFGYLLDFDEIWTQKNLLPLFDPDSDDFYAAWAGFLTQKDLNPAVAEVMADPFLNAVERINSDHFNQRDLFIEYYIYILTSVVEDPLDEWIPKFFQSASQETKDCFAAKVGFRLRNMTEAERQEWWQRWLKRYWKNRLQGVPASEPESGEAAQVLNWLPHLTSVFPEAVDVAVQMTASSLQGCYVIEELSINDENDLWQRHPESVVKLLIYLWECNLPGHSWYSGRDLIDDLLSSNISSKLKGELEEIKVQL